MIWQLTSCEEKEDDLSYCCDLVMVVINSMCQHRAAVYLQTQTFKVETYFVVNSYHAFMEDIQVNPISSNTVFLCIKKYTKIL